MTQIDDAARNDFFAAVRAASQKAIWCAIASCAGGAPRVRMVHPTWEGESLWFATGSTSPKATQIAANPQVDVQYQVAPPDFVHVLVRGRAEIVEDAAEKKRVWDVIDYDLGQFWSGGPTDPNYALVRVTPDRVELSKMFGIQDKQVWRRG